MSNMTLVVFRRGASHNTSQYGMEEDKRISSVRRLPLH
jgi:hypothetical protein